VPPRGEYRLATKDAAICHLIATCSIYNLLTMKKFIHEENLKLFRRQLAETTDAERRKVLLKLLEDEQANDVDLVNSQRADPVGKPDHAP